MKFTARFFAITATVSQVLALELTNSAYSVTEGQPFTITWTNANGPVTLLLKDGASNDLKTVTTIASGLTGTSFTWTPSGLPSDQYAIEISDSSETNYSPQFPYAGTGTVSVTSAGTTTAAATTTKDSSSSAATTGASTTSTGSSSAPSSSSAANSSSTASSSSNSTTTASSTLSRATSSSTGTSTSSSSTSTNTPVNTNDGKRLGSSLAFVVLTAAALLVCH